MAVDIVYAPRAPTTDDEAGRVTGWQPGELTGDGRRYARELGQRHRGTGLSAIFCSDLGRVVRTVEIAFRGYRIPIHRDTRLRGCDYGDRTGVPLAELAPDRLAYLDRPFPNGHSYREVVDRTARFLVDLAAAWDGHRVLLVGHRSTGWALEHLLDRVPLADLLRGPPPARGDRSYVLPTGWSGVDRRPYPGGPAERG